MRLGILADTAAPHTLRWARWFARHGHEVHVISFNPSEQYNYEPAIVHTIWKPYLGNMFVERVFKLPIILARIHGIFRQYPPDIIHAHSAGGYAWVSMMSGFRPYVVTPWGTDLLVDIEHSCFNRWLTGLALRNAALVTTDGFHFIEILGRFGIHKEEIFLHTFGTDINLFSPRPDDSERRVLGIESCPIIISTRTLNPVHDVETFVRALPKIHAEYPETRFIVVGDGTDRVRLENLTKVLGVESAVIFTGMVEEDRMSRLLRASDIYVSTSRMDAGLAASTAEAMATGLPVVQTDNSDNAYWTPHGEGGLLVPNENPEAVADAVIHLLNSPDIRLRMGKRNRQMIMNEYNMDIEMKRIEEEYKRILSKLS